MEEKGQGTILRLIDVVLIILVGFVSIADLSEKSRIRFPYTQKEAQEQSEDQQELAIISIIVTSSLENMRAENRERLDEDGVVRQYNVELFNAEYLINWRQGDIEENRAADSPEALKRELRALMRENSAEIEAVNVIPTELSPVGGTVEIYDIAQQLDLPFPGVDLTSDATNDDQAAAGE
jgi:preprotein translocase subunit SecF